MVFSMQEYWSGLLPPPPGDLADPGIQWSLGGIFTTSATWEVSWQLFTNCCLLGGGAHCCASQWMSRAATAGACFTATARGAERGGSRKQLGRKKHPGPSSNVSCQPLVEPGMQAAKTMVATSRGSQLVHQSWSPSESVSAVDSAHLWPQQPVFDVRGGPKLAPPRAELLPAGLCRGWAAGAGQSGEIAAARYRDVPRQSGPWLNGTHRWAPGREGHIRPWVLIWEATTVPPMREYELINLIHGVLRDTDKKKWQIHWLYPVHKSWSKHDLVITFLLTCKCCCCCCCC